MRGFDGARKDNYSSGEPVTWTEVEVKVIKLKNCMQQLRIKL